MEAVVERPAVATRNAKAAPTSKSQGGAAAVAADHNGLTWRDAALAARNSVSTLLFEACVRDEEERNDNLGLAKRLMAVANGEIGELAAGATKKEFESAAFNVEAMLHGALALSDDPVGPEVRGKLTHALIIIDRLTDVLGGGSSFGALLEAIAAQPSPVPQVRNMAPPLCEASRPKAPTDGIRNAHAHLNEAVAVLEAYAHLGGSDACFGVCSLLNLAAEEVARVLSATRKEVADAANEAIAQALAMLEMYANADAEAHGDLVVHGVITLAELGKSEFDHAFEGLA